MEDNCVGAERSGKLFKNLIDIVLKMTKKRGIKVDLGKADTAQGSVVADFIAPGMPHSPSGLLIEIARENGNLRTLALKRENLLTGYGFGAAEGNGLIPVRTN